MDEREERVVKTRSTAGTQQNKTRSAHAGLPENQRIQGWIRIAYRRLREGKRAAGQGEDEEIC